MNISKLLFGEYKNCKDFQGEHKFICFHFEDGTSSKISLPAEIIFIGVGCWDIEYPNNGYLIGTSWDFCKEEYCPVLFSDHKWGLINKYFEIVTPLLYDSLGEIYIGCGCHRPPYANYFWWNENETCLVELNGEKIKLYKKDLIDNNSISRQSYRQRIESIVDLTLDAFIENCKSHISNRYKLQPYYHPELNHGVELLHSEEGLDCYVASYGEMHQIKCRASLQTLKFEEIGNFEVWDWGCGQGLASLSLIDMLKEKRMLFLLKKVTLVEPSEPALDRAELNIKKVCPNINVISVNKFLPFSEEQQNEIKFVDYSYKKVVHLFSNILDIEAINLTKLARLISKPGTLNYIMCCGPLNRGAYRLDAFASLFNNRTKLCNIENNVYGYTSNHKKFTCKSICFIHNGNSLNLEYDNSLHLLRKEERIPKDDYDIEGLIAQANLPKSMVQFYKRIESSMELNEHDSIFIAPTIGSDEVDMALLRPDKGVLLLNVYAGNPDAHQIIDAVDELNRLKGNLMRLHLEDVWGKIVAKSKYAWSMIRLGLYFPNSTCNDLYQWLQSNKDSNMISGRRIETIGQNIPCGIDYVRFVGNDSLTSTPMVMQFGWFAPIFPNPDFGDVTYKSVLRILSPDWHFCQEGKGIELDRIQKELAKYPNVTKQINGVAGSGKTQVLVQRAVNTHLATGKSILILSYNIALANYLRYRLNQVKADFGRGEFEITSYHRFFKKNALSLHLTPKRSLAEPSQDNADLIKDEYEYSYDDISFFKGKEFETKRFCHIFIDEIQDFKSEWVQIIKEYFLEKDGEIVVFGDASQNIYNRPLDNKGQIKVEVARNGWNNSLTKSHRFMNETLSNFIMRFHAEFIKNTVSQFSTNIRTIDFQEFRCLFYYNVETDKESTDIASLCNEIIINNDLPFGEVAIVSNYTQILRELDYNLRHFHSQSIKSTFATKDEIELIRKTNPCYSESDIRNIDRSKKIHFTMENQCIKISTIHSFKGWESPNVILIIEQQETNSELIYTALTRARERLFIINMGNKKYHEFLSSTIYTEHRK